MYNYNDDFWDLLAKMANLAQLINFMMETEDLNNSDISAKLDEQNNDYLEVILNNQKEILERLERLEVEIYNGK